MAQSVAEVIADLETERDRILVRLGELELGPSFSIDGVSIQSEWDALWARLEKIWELLEKFRGPTVVFSVGE